MGVWVVEPGACILGRRRDRGFWGGDTGGGNERGVATACPQALWRTAAGRPSQAGCPVLNWVWLSFHRCFMRRERWREANKIYSPPACNYLLEEKVWPTFLKSSHISPNLRWVLLCCVKYILFSGIWYQIPALSSCLEGRQPANFIIDKQRATHSCPKALKEVGASKERLFFSSFYHHLSCLKTYL